MKTAIITGADGAMGMEITLAVAKAGYRVVMVCADERHGLEARERVVEETGNADISVKQCDLSVMDNVVRLTEDIKAEEQSIDLLMNNAGTMQEGRVRTVDGFEKTVAVNYLAPMILTERLLPKINTGARIVFMVSLSANWGRIDYPEFFAEGRKGGFWRILVYSNTKLALSCYLLRLARRLEEKGISVNGTDPGIVSTPMIRMNMWFDWITDLIYRPLIRTPKQGADTAIHLLLNEAINGQTGGIYHSRKRKRLGNKYSEERQEELWQKTKNIISKWI